MPSSDHDLDSDKRKAITDGPGGVDARKRARIQNATSSNETLLAPHDAILAELKPKYNVLAASVISSTQIRKRVVYITNHLLEQSEERRVVLLHARTADVCKLISVVEQCKRVLVDEGKAWYQYNQLFEPPRKPDMRSVVEETIIGPDPVDEGDDSDDEHFEVMRSRFENAVLPRLVSNTIKSMRIFLSIASVPEVRSKPDVTTQTSVEKA